MDTLKKKPLLSIGMIVKNEYRCIERCLKALEPLRQAIPCELVIADTGSDDGTREIVERYADLVFDFPWINDFAAARNAVMDHCCGTWYLSIDADEYLDPDISQLVQFLTSNSDMDYAVVMVRNYNTLAMQEDDYSDFKGLRLTRMATGVRFTGVIHETWITKDQQPVYLMDRVILHHDGYASDLGDYRIEKKKRNMELIRAELQENPHDIRRLLQAVESCEYCKEEQTGYLRRSMMVLMDSGTAFNHNFAAPLWRYAIQWACDSDLPELETWLTWGIEHFSDSAFFRLDVVFFMEAYYYKKKVYDQALKWGRQYLENYNRYLSQKYIFAEETYSPLSCKSQHNLSLGEVVLASTLQKLGQEQEALDILYNLDAVHSEKDILQNTLVVLRDLFDNSELQMYAVSLCSQIATVVLNAEPDEKNAVENRTLLLQLAVQIFNGKKWKLFSQTSGELGSMARAMDITDGKLLSLSLEDIENWKEVPNAVVLHAIECGATLPEAFYQKGQESLRNTAVDVGNKDSMPKLLLRWGKVDEFTNRMSKLQFLFELTAAVLRSNHWNKEYEGPALSRLFLSLCQSYLTRYYNPELIQSTQDWDVIPGLHRFGLYLLLAQNSLKQGNEVEYVQQLHAALKSAPAMKQLTRFYLEQLEKQKYRDASPELLELSEKVRTILAQYPPDDPAVEALKQSEVYQKVAYLIEGMEAPAFGGLPQ